MKNKKRLLIIIACAILAAIIALLLILNPFGSKTVSVYPVQNLISYGDFSDSGSMNGTVRSEGIQKIFVSDTQKINEVYVRKGQHVEIGDALLSYDTTLSEIELERASLEVKKLELELNEAKAELAKINAMVPSSQLRIDPDNSWIHYDPVTTPYFLSGEGSEADPMYFIVDSSNLFQLSFFESYMPEGASALYAVLLEREHNAINGKIKASFGLVIYPGEDGEFSFKPFTAEIPEDIEKYDQPQEPYYEHKGSDFSAGEIASMRAEAEAKIREIDLQIKISSLEYEKKTKEASDNVVRAGRSGTVKETRDPEEAYKNGEAVVEISDGGGYFVDVELSELNLKKAKTGDTVMIESYMDGMSYEGSVVKVSDVPSQYSDLNHYGNVNVSYYPMTVSVSEEANLKEGDYVGVSFQQTQDTSDSFYIESMFVRTEKDGAYVYAASENGKLEKRRIKTGKNMYGYEVEIKEGLTEEDRIAFPYGKSVKPGARIKDAELDELYR